MPGGPPNNGLWRSWLMELPEALNILDRFHVAAHLNAAVDDVRRIEGGSLKKSAKKRSR